MRFPCASSESSNPKKQKTRWGLARQRADECVSIKSLGATQRARHAAVMMMMPMRPEMIQNAHLLNQSLNKPVPGVNPRKCQKIDTLNVFCECLQRLTFSGPSVIFDSYLVEVRIPLVAGPAFPISFGGSRERGKCC
jgi:hypothetical protein